MTVWWHIDPRSRLPVRSTRPPSQINAAYADPSHHTRIRAEERALARGRADLAHRNNLNNDIQNDD